MAVVKIAKPLSVREARFRALAGIASQYEALYHDRYWWEWQDPITRGVWLWFNRRAAYWRSREKLERARLSRY